MGNGSLTIVGTGISIGQVTAEARGHIEIADRVLALVADPVTYNWITKLNSSTESLQHLYAEGKPRQRTYEDIVEYAMGLLRGRADVCLVLYGHPGVFAFPSHELMRRTRSEGIPARMLAGVSAEDCIFADLGVDPGNVGCQSYEATDFLVYNRRFDSTSLLILWQFGITGDLGYPTQRKTLGVETLAGILSRSYPPDHGVIVYEASPYPLCDPIIRRVPLIELAQTEYSPISTLVIPALASRLPDVEMVERLGLIATSLRSK
jgi:uncharacterized protein YabN with tetrapyrrole methylase and pyrophosphatase domain